MKKRILSVLLTLVMLIGLVTVMSVSASAAGEHTHCVCGGAAAGHLHSVTAPTWQEWDGTSAITYDSNKTAYVYLSGNAERSSTLSVAAATRSTSA